MEVQKLRINQVMLGIVFGMPSFGLTAGECISDITRIRYKQAEAIQCEQEVQVKVCHSDGSHNWTGSNEFLSCKVKTLPLVTFDAFQYIGGFKVTANNIGVNNKSNFNYSHGVMAYNDENNSLFVVGHTQGQQVAELAIPEITNSLNPDDFATAAHVLQPMVEFNLASRLGTLVSNFRINGMKVLDERLVVNFMNARDYSNDISPTTFVLQNKDDIANSPISPLSTIEGGLFASGWLAEVPEYWQTVLGGDLLAGAPGPTITAKTTLGPSAYILKLTDLTSAGHLIPSHNLLSFPYSTPLLEYGVHDAGMSIGAILNNQDLHNEFWTLLSNAVYGFVVPDSSTYMTIGHSSGHQSGIGYGITQDNGYKCSGFCTYRSDDYSAYIWLWDLNDLASVKNGRLAAHDVRPYYAAPLPLPFHNKVTGATFDKKHGRLFLSLLNNGLDTTTYNRTPTILVYQLQSMIVSDNTSNQADSEAEGGADNNTHEDSTVDAGNDSDIIDGGVNEVFANCGDFLHGQTLERTRYAESLVPFGSTCEQETQTSYCDNGVLSDWTGSYSKVDCRVNYDHMPLYSINQLQYQGGFRISPSIYGESKADYSKGTFTYNQNNHSIYLVGHPNDGSAIAEFAVPDLVMSRDILDFNTSTPIQGFSKFYGTSRVNTGIDGYFRITGLELIDNKLLVNYVNWYDAAGKETDTSVWFENAADLSLSEIRGPYQIAGAAHAAGWLSPVPSEWQAEFGATHISGGQHNISVISRRSVGPSAFGINPEEDIFGSFEGEVPSTPLLDFPLQNMLYQKEIYGSSIESTSAILYNDNRSNNLWTIVSGAGYGFIIPGTRTYLTIGSSGGHESGLGYKITQTNGNLCAGPCSYDPSDNYSYYWLWSVEDLIKVKKGQMKPYEVRPYEFGKLDMPVDLEHDLISGGAFDSESSMLYLSIATGDREHRYARPPVFIVFKVK